MVAHTTTPAQPPPVHRVLIATPLNGGQMYWETAKALIQRTIEDIPGIQFVWECWGGFGITAARNELAHLMYARNCSATLCWDADIVAPCHYPLGLIQHGVDCVGGLYRHKTEERLTWCCNFIPGEVPNANGLLRVEDIGAGFLYFTRRLCDAMIVQGIAKKYTRGFATAKPPGTVMYDFFSEGVIEDPLHGGEPTFKTEDFAFAHRVRLAGYQVHADTRIRCDHLGTHKFRADVAGMPEPWTVQV